jgi:hypothetical protein
VWTAFAGRRRRFFLWQRLRLLHGPSAAYLGVHFDEVPNELFEAAEFSDFAF